MPNEPGYPLPDGELGEDEIVCQLVYLPDRPEYWQAFLGAYHYLTTWRAWERDTGKRGRDAAANWREAFELTIGCWRMTCLQDLQDDVAAILAIMQLGQSCCDDQDITDGDRYTDRVTDGEGDVPQNVIDAGYADDSADWEGFDDYKCMIVHVVVNNMEQKLIEIESKLDEHGLMYGGIVALAGVLGVIFATGGIAIIFGLIAGVSTLSTLYNALIGFGLLSDLADDVATNHDELACAMYYSDGDEAAIVALNDKIDELFSVPEALILKNLGNGPTLKALYAGRYDQQDVAAELEAAGYDLGDFDCECLIPVGEFVLEYPWLADKENWDDFSIATHTVGFGNPVGCMMTYHSGGTYGQIRKSSNQFGTDIGKSSEAGDLITIHRISFDAKVQAGAAGDLRLAISHDSTTTYKTETLGTSWVHYDYEFDPPLVHEDGVDSYVLIFRVINGNGRWHYVDNFRIDFDADMD